METHSQSTKVSDLLLFKSYYVVWKLFRIFRSSDAFFRFKSYYVVWKQSYNTNEKEKIDRLNRTM